ncbi:hypothetical protein [Streptacidiphilus sp. P02-A3a]|uniref:hypothetical protein n=1 Tax=Streptacidiphilus sp. P02-A3a TaxID=2704468 RepID=UPI0015F9DA1A|nr:hypothetical protein [Streptacidiphilus sp. P02-A3a]QMU71433.1 hypothetical protein GXP74_27570 [Streptacidiphilus sp. P02-A3a]
MTVTGADELLVAVGTGYRGHDRQPVGPDQGPAEEVGRTLAAADLPYQRLREEHLADHRRLPTGHPPTGLADCHEPLFELIADLTVTDPTGRLPLGSP